MSAYVPPYAPSVVLAFLGTVLLLAACGLTFLVGLLRRSRRILLGAAGTGATVLAGYLVILIGFSAFSREVSLPIGAWKYFCEIDCHIANAVTNVRTAATAGPEAQQISSSGQFVIVELKTWFDLSTIGPQRGNGPLTPNARSVVLLDSTGRQYRESAKALAVLAALRLSSTPLRTALRPGATYVSYCVFEVPADRSKLRLQLSAADVEDALLWGHENSPMHQKITFSLEPLRGVASSGSL
jgi:hypothetical protein